MPAPAREPNGKRLLSKGEEMKKLIASCFRFGMPSKLSSFLW
jgi:hypothetical protein